MFIDNRSIDEILALPVRQNFEKECSNSFELNFKGMKWNQLFQDQEELLYYTKKIDFLEFEKYGKGLHYMKSFTNILQNDQELTSVQITQLKRMSQEVYKYHQDMKFNKGLYRKL